MKPRHSRNPAKTAPSHRVKITRVKTHREARELDRLDAEVWGSRNPAKHRYFGQFLWAGMRVYRATVGGRLAGASTLAGAFITGYGTSANLMELEELMVLPAFRRMGVGAACLEFAKQEARKRGHLGIVVEVDARNRRARDWYRRNGLATVGWVMVDNKRAWIEEERPVRPKGGRG